MNNDKLTIDILRAFEANPETSKLRAAVITARAEAKRIRAQVDAYIAPVFAACGPFPIAEKKAARRGGPAHVTKPADLYLCDDEAKVAAFYAACDDAHRANGYNLAPGYCPALVAETAVGTAERALLKHAGNAVGIDFGVASMSLRERALNLFLTKPRT